MRLIPRTSYVIVLVGATFYQVRRVRGALASLAGEACARVALTTGCRGAQRTRGGGDARGEYAAANAACAPQAILSLRDPDRQAVWGTREHPNAAKPLIQRWWLMTKGFG